MPLWLTFGYKLKVSRVSLSCLIHGHVSCSFASRGRSFGALWSSFRAVTPIEPVVMDRGPGARLARFARSQWSDVMCLPAKTPPQIIADRFARNGKTQ